MADVEILDEIARTTASAAPEALAVDEDFWALVSRQYDRDESFVQLNYGYYHPALRPVVDVEVAALREINRRGSHFKALESTKLLEAARGDVAELAGAENEEIVLTRNASEALNIVVQGIPLARGDEIVCSNQDYVALEQVLNQRAQHDGAAIRRAALPLLPASDDEVIKSFEAELTERTRLLVITHLIHLTGQVLPVEKLCALGRARGIPVLVDAAHSFAQLAFSIRDLGCDYLAASLHKWLGAPLGTGLLFVRWDRIGSLRPLFGDTHFPVNNIRRLERFGNRPDSAYAGLREAIRWHRALTTPVKQARLAHLQRRWAEPIRALPGFNVLTPNTPGRYGAIGLVSLEGLAPESVFEYLLSEHRLFATTIKHIVVNGLRITPGLPTSEAEIDRLVVALQGAPAALRAKAAAEGATE